VQSGGVALIATIAMFAAAFIAMRSVRLFPVFSSPAEEISPPTIIRFEPPTSKPIPKPEARPTTVRSAPPTLVAPTTVPTAVAPPITTPAPITAPPPDSAPGGRRRITDLLPTEPGLKPPAPLANVRGAPIATAGVTAPFRPFSEAERDSIDAARARAYAEALRRPFTKEEKEAVERQAEPGKGLKNTREGSDGKVVPLMNGGVSVAMKPMLSISVGGKSAAERKREAAIDSANRVILYRLQDRARLLRDSLRADSLAKRIRP
jgi:hypothetical protein